MSDNNVPRQLSRIEMQEMAAKNPAALMKAYEAGQFDELLKGNNPGDCPTCNRPLADA